MATMAKTIQNAIIPEPEAVAQPGAAQLDDTAIETQLTQEISTLWSDHVRLSASRKATAKELRQIRASLAERLHAMKSLLSHPGRGREWRGRLRERGIPRSTTDRLVARRAETLCADNVPAGAISEPAEAVAEKLAKGVWPRFRKVLATDEAVVQFISGIAEISGVPHQWREEGLMMFHAMPKAAGELPGSASATDHSSQPFDEASAVTEESGEGTAAAPPAAGQAGGVDDASNGGVLQAVSGLSALPNGARHGNKA